MNVWALRNGNVPTLSSYARVKRLCFSRLRQRPACEAEYIDWAYRKRFAQLVSSIANQRLTISHHPPMLWQGIEALLVVRRDRVWFVKSHHFLVEAEDGCIGMMGAAALRTYDAFLTRNEVSFPRNIDQPPDPHVIATTAALLIGDALCAYHGENPALLEGALEQIFAGEMDFEEFFARHLPPPYLPEEHRRELLGQLDRHLLLQYLPRVLSIFFVIVGLEGKGFVTWRERRKEGISALFNWAELHVSEHPSTLFYLAYALASHPTGLTDEWLPKCFSLFDQHTIPYPTDIDKGDAWRCFLLAQDRFTDYTHPLPWLKGQKMDTRNFDKLLRLCMRTNHHGGVVALLQQQGFSRERPLHYKAARSTLVAATIRTPGFPLERRSIDALIDVLDLRSLTIEWCRVPGYRQLPQEVAALLLLWERVSKNPRIRGAKYAAVRGVFNEILPEINRLISLLQTEEGILQANSKYKMQIRVREGTILWDQELVRILPKEPLSPLGVPAGLFARSWCWLRYTLWPIVQLAALLFPRVIAYLPREAYHTFVRGGWIARLVTVGCSAAVTALFACYLVPCVCTTLLLSALISLYHALEIRDGWREVEQVGAVTGEGTHSYFIDWLDTLESIEGRAP